MQELSLDDVNAEEDEQPVDVVLCDYPSSGIFTCTTAQESMAFLHKVLFVASVLLSPMTIKARFALVHATFLETLLINEQEDICAHTVAWHLPRSRCPPEHCIEQSKR
jgi:hypothetical protein